MTQHPNEDQYGAYSYFEPSNRTREQEIDMAYDEKETIDMIARKIFNTLSGLETDLEFAKKDINDSTARQRIQAMIYAISACDYANVTQELAEDANRVVREIKYVE